MHLSFMAVQWIEWLAAGGVYLYAFAMLLLLSDEQPEKQHVFKWKRGPFVPPARPTLSPAIPPGTFCRAYHAAHRRDRKRVL